MLTEKDFTPVLRFMVCSDVHLKDEPCVEEERFEKAIKIANRLSRENSAYDRLDAICIVGDFANNGSEIQMKKAKKILDETKLPETSLIISLASHEYSQQNGGEAAARARFTEIFDLPLDAHEVINGFHFISVTSTEGCHYREPQRAFAEAELKKARADAPKKPIFFFQHPHIFGTVAGSVCWGEDELNDILVNFPAVIDFSGHSHMPINDPRSIHQRHFTCLGTGTLSYFELDEFDKKYGTVPPKSHDAAQMLIVEADAQGRVRVYPYDVLTDSLFREPWRIDSAWEPDSFTYTDLRLKSAAVPYFPEDAVISAVRDGDDVVVEFTQAKDDEEGFVNDYIVSLRDDNGVVMHRIVIWSEYYFKNMPEKLTVRFENAEKCALTAEVFGKSFWNNETKRIKAKVE